MNVQSYDLLMLLVLAGATILGFWKGLAWQLASLASLVVSYFVALRFSAQLAPMFGQQAPLNRLAAMGAIYAATSFVVWMLFRFVSGAIDQVKLQAFDKQMGAFVGFAKGVLLCIAITFFAMPFLPPAQAQIVANSQSGHYIVALLNKAETMVPPEYHQLIVPYLDKVEERISTGNPSGQGFQLGWPGGSSNTNVNAASTPFQLPQISWPGASPQMTTQPQTGQPQTAQPQTAWPQQPSGPQMNPSQPAWPSQQQLGWPAQTQSQPQPTWSSQSSSQLGWPTQQAGQTESPVGPQNVDPYSVPREPNPFPDPGYSAERPGGATY
jgi:membrane protein required for colicin V production